MFVVLTENNSFLGSSSAWGLFMRHMKGTKIHEIKMKWYVRDKRDKLKEKWNWWGEIDRDKTTEWESGIKARGTDLKKVDQSESEIEAQSCLTGSRCWELMSEDHNLLPNSWGLREREKERDRARWLTSAAFPIRDPDSYLLTHYYNRIIMCFLITSTSYFSL